LLLDEALDGELVVGLLAHIETIERDPGVRVLSRAGGASRMTRRRTARWP
jgi:hypothetical protein